MTGAMLALTLALASCAKENPRADDMKAMAETGKTEQTAAKTTLNADDPHVMKISVPTMECETCAEAITKGVKTVPEAEDVNVDVDTKTVFVKVADNTPEMRTKIENAISSTGYSTDKVARNEDAFNKLPKCCKVGGEKGEKKEM